MDSRTPPPPIGDRIAKDFASHNLTEAQAQATNEVRAVLKDAADKLAVLVPAGREQALVFTNLEQAMFWSNAGIARTPPKVG